jgi:signal transduction histidine kinase
MNLGDVPRLYRRAILIYLGTIVAPACGLLWLGLHSFETQREALATLQSEKLEAELESVLRGAAENALARQEHPVAKFFFTIDHGVVIRPVLQAPPPLPTPPDFQEAEHEEQDLHRADMALVVYQKLLASHRNDSLALSGIARCLQQLGRKEEAVATWRKLASSYADERTLSHRPYGIVAAIAAGDTAGLFDKIASGRWELSADQAEYFLAEVDPQRATPYLDQFRFARELSEQFRPQNTPRENEIQSYRFGGTRVFYREETGGRISGFAVNHDWIEHVLRPQLAETLGFQDGSGRSLRIYGGAMAAVFMILSAGVFLLWRDISRETRTNRLRSDFVSGVSHELKTPITLIRLYGETLIERSGLSEAERGDFFRIIVRESERLSRLVNQILTFSRIERGAQVYTLSEGDVAPVVAGVVDDYREYLERSGFRVQRTLPDSVPLVRFDPAALSQAVVNLLDNAVKYSGPSRDIAVRLEAHNGSVVVEVEDHGVGIALSDQQRIFERFYRAANGSGKGGYGLGLYLVRHAMDAHQGRAEVESEPGRGSRFRLVFPVVNPRATA